MNYFEEALDRHSKTKGKISVECRMPLENAEDLSVAYTPGVAQPCREIHKDRDKVYEYTSKGNMVAVVSDGTAVLGLGNIGARAAIPVMEGKAVLFKKFGGVDAVPICLNTTDTEELIRTVKLLEPCFGGINLEDISAPRCFEIERRLEEEMEIPVFHDDQHGTAIVVTAALINAMKLTNRKMDEINVVLNGPGAAGTAIIHMLLEAGVKHIIACNRKGILHQDAAGELPIHQQELIKVTNKEGRKGTLKDALAGADVFIGVSGANILTQEMIKAMNPDPIVFAMANPDPEISYTEAMEASVKIIGTGRSDYPNQINNVLAFPGVFKGALQVRAPKITGSMKVAAAYAIAELIPESELREDYIIPSPFHPGIAAHVAERVAAAAVDASE